MNTLFSSRAIFHRALLLLCGSLLFTACPTMRDAVTRNNLADLKTAHLAFIDEFTEGTGKTWDDQNLATRKAALESQFAAAEQQATKTKDANRTKALSTLHSLFTKHAAMLESQKAFFRPTFAANRKTVVAKAYDQALKGEDIRQ
jgi:hypothetical protein